MTGTTPKQKFALWPWLKDLGDVNLAIALFSLALIAYIWITAISEGRAERDEAIAAAVKQNSNLAVAYEEHMIRTVNGLDAVTRFVRHEYQRLGARMDLDKYISNGVIDRRIFSILSVVDARGDIVYSTTPLARINYADRDRPTSGATATRSTSASPCWDACPARGRSP